jgi:hypothetical protein
MDTSALKAFIRWGAKYSAFPYSELQYWIDAYERGDGTDMYGRRIL